MRILPNRLKTYSGSRVASSELMSFNKIKDFYITLSLNEHLGYIAAGSTVEGKVIIDLAKSKRTTGPLRITLSGQAIVQWGQAPALRRNAQKIFDDMTVYLWGTGAETLAPGKHEFPYTFHLPTDIPSSHEDFYGHIRYILTTALPTRNGEVIRQKRVNIRGIVDVDRPDLLHSLNDSDSKTLSCCCCFTSAPIELSASIDRGGYLSGESICITERHGCRRITSACAILLRKTVYHARTTDARSAESNFSYKRIASTVFTSSLSSDPGVRVGGITIPNNTVPSINYDVLTVSYYVHVTLEFKLPFCMVKHLSVMIPITIGNVRSMTGIGVGSPLRNSSVQPTTAPALHPLSNTLQGSAIQPTSAAYAGAYPVSDGASLQPMLSGTFPSAPPPNTMPSAPVEPMLSTMASAPMEPVLNTVPSAPVYPMPNTLPIASAPILPDAGVPEAPDTPPPPYSEF